MTKKVDKFRDENDWINWKGKEVIKHSKKPFKSGKITGIVVDLTTNPNSGKVAFRMNDESVVDCFQVKLFVDENN